MKELKEKSLSLIEKLVMGDKRTQKIYDEWFNLHGKYLFKEWFYNKEERKIDREWLKPKKERNVSK